MEVGFELRPWRPGDEAAINDGFNQVFGQSRALDEWSWKFCRAPVPSPIMLAWDDQGLLSQYAGIPARVQVGGGVYWAAQIVDVFSTRRARRLFARRGVYVRTVEAFFEQFGESGEFRLLYGFPGKRALRLGVLQLGYDAMEPLPIRQLSRALDAGAGSLRSRLYRAQEVSWDHAEIARLWERVGSRYAAGVVRDGARVKQRLAGHPSVEYRILLIFRRWGREPVGWVAFRVDSDVVRWMDLVWDEAHPGALELATRVARRLAREAGAASEQLWLNGDDKAREVLLNMGYLEEPEPNGLVLVAKSFPGGPDLDAMRGGMYLTMADADLW